MHFVIKTAFKLTNTLATENTTEPFYLKTPSYLAIAIDKLLKHFKH